MEDQFARTNTLLGPEAMRSLAAARVAVFGLGGVGGICAEALARTGVGSIDLFDHDTVSITNLNRQVIALHSTLGQFKADVMAARLADINPGIEVRAVKLFYTPDTSDEIDLKRYDYVVDAIDTVAGKIELIAQSKKAGTAIICAMGAANKTDPLALVVTDIRKTDTDPLAKAVRKELRARNIEGVKAVWSKEEPRIRCRPPASGAVVPQAMGLLLASEVIKDLANK